MTWQCHQLKGFPTKGVPYLLCYVSKWQYLCKVWTEVDKNYTSSVKSPVDPKYEVEVRIDVRDPEPKKCKKIPLCKNQPLT